MSEFAGQQFHEGAVSVFPPDDGESGQGAGNDAAGLIGAFVGSHEKRCFTVLRVTPPPNTVAQLVTNVVSVVGGAKLSWADVESRDAAGRIGYLVRFWPADKDNVPFPEQNPVNAGLTLRHGEDGQRRFVADRDTPGRAHLHRKGESAGSSRAVKEMGQRVHSRRVDDDEGFADLWALGVWRHAGLVDA
ncbi:hypothetical protein GCM10017708_06500 [Arthrobacter citreus]